MTPARMLAPLLLAFAAGTTGHAQESQTEIRLDSQRAYPSGEVAYQKLCSSCHTGLEHTVGPDLLLGYYDADILRFFVRNGSGPMPAFTEAMIDDASIDEIAVYLEQNHKGDAQ